MHSRALLYTFPASPWPPLTAALAHGQRAPRARQQRPQLSQRRCHLASVVQQPLAAGRQRGRERLERRRRVGGGEVAGEVAQLPLQPAAAGLGL